MKKVIVLGGGFAGVQTAIKLQKSGKFEVTMISDRDFLYLYPISIWIPVRIKEFEDVKIPMEKISKKHHFRVIIDKVTQIKAAENTVICENQQFSFDYLIVAFGADKMVHKGMEHTLSICGKPGMSVEIRDRLDALVQKGSGKIAVGFGGNPKDKSAVRGGPAFELMFNIHNYLKKKKIRQNFELNFFAPMAEPGAKMGSNALKMIDMFFNKYKIGKRFGIKITEFSAEGVHFEDGSILNADFTMFISASTGPAILKNSDLPLSDSGFVKIDDYQQVTGFENVYAIGDIAALEGPEWAAKQGHLAELMGSNAAFNIIQKENGSNERKGYQQHLNILCIMDTGDGAAFVYRKGDKSLLIPMPVVGHWLKKAWGFYNRVKKAGF